MSCHAPSGGATCVGTAIGAQLTYDNQGQLASWQSALGSPTATDRFLYDGESNRIEQVATTSGTTTTTIYVGRLEEMSTSGTTIAYYGGAAKSVSESVTASGVVTATQLYRPYGSVRYASGTLPTDYAFTGQRADATSGLDYYGAR